MKRFDLAVIGAGISGCTLLAHLHQGGFQGTVALVEAGRGPGGRTATRQRRQVPGWRLDHGAPGFNLTTPTSATLEPVLAPLRAKGIVRREWGTIAGLDEQGCLVEPPGMEVLDGEWLRGHPTMASVCEGLLELASPQIHRHFGCRVRHLKRVHDGWWLLDEQSQQVLSARRLVLSGTLLAHPRSLAMLAWQDVPLREAVPAGHDPQLDAVLNTLSMSTGSVRWNLMVQFDNAAQQQIPRQIWLTAKAQQQWQVERLVVQPQTGAGVGLVVHGLHDGSSITADRQPGLLAQQQQRLSNLLPHLIDQIPGLKESDAKVLGLMRWGAAQPLDHPLARELQWCPISEIGFCGDWIEGPGFGRAEGALTSAVALADRLVKA